MLYILASRVDKGMWYWRSSVIGLSSLYWSTEVNNCLFELFVYFSCVNYIRCCYLWYKVSDKILSFLFLLWRGGCMSGRCSNNISFHTHEAITRGQSKWTINICQVECQYRKIILRQLSNVNPYGNKR